MHCVDFFFLGYFFSGFFWAFLTIFAPNLSIYHQNYVKNGFIFKTANLIFFFSTQCIILLLFLWFSQIKMGGGHFEPPLIITKVCKPPTITKVNKANIHVWYCLRHDKYINMAQLSPHNITNKEYLTHHVYMHIEGQTVLKLFLYGVVLSLFYN